VKRFTFKVVEGPIVGFSILNQGSAACRFNQSSEDSILSDS